MARRRAAAAKIETELSFSAHDFSSLEFVISFSNRTSRFDLNGSEGGGCEVREFLDSGMVLEVPRAACAKGHILSFEIAIQNSGTPLKLAGLARVTEVETLDGIQQLIRVEFVKISAKAWACFKNAYAARQDQVLELLSKMRGY